MADGARKSCFAAIFLLDMYNLPHPLNCVIQVVSTCKRCLYALTSFFLFVSDSVSPIPICFFAQMQGTSNDGDPGCSGE